MRTGSEFPQELQKIYNKLAQTGYSFLLQEVQSVFPGHFVYDPKTERYTYHIEGYVRHVDLMNQHPSFVEAVCKILNFAVSENKAQAEKMASRHARAAGSGIRYPGYAIEGNNYQTVEELYSEDAQRLRAIKACLKQMFRIK